jgi:arylsulfatase A-like enzyme/Tfp pilus assembly protein PilF
MPIRRLVLPFVFLLASPAGAASRPNVVLITLDTTRADRMGFLGSNKGLTPNLDAVAKQGVVFTRAYSHVPLTTASHATLLAGTYPQFNHVNDFGVPLASSLPYLPDILKQSGYQTGAFVGSVILDPLGGMSPGFDRGFDTYDAGFRLRPRGADRYKTIERRADVVVSRALAWLAKHKAGPFFLWVHLYDAHDPYDPPEPYKTRYKSAPYDGEIAYTDAAVGKLLSTLRVGGLYQNTLIAVAADHGEAFGEHGERTHGIFLYDETIHVPLLFKLPSSAFAASRIEARVGLIDVMPTILKEIGLPVPADVQGDSLLQIIKTKSVSDRPAYAETDYPRRAFGWSSLRTLRSGKYLYVQAPEKELYDQTTDLKAEHNLAASSPAVANTIHSQLDNLRSKTSRSLTDLAGLTPEQVQKLQALGYVASDSTKPESSEKNGPAVDPKQKIEIANLLHDAMLDVEDSRYEEAIPGLEKVIAQQPTMAIAQMQLGIARASLKQYDKAITPLRTAIEILPDSGLGHYELGLALFETGEWKAAAPEFEAALKRAPKWADAHFSLAAVYARIDRVPEAMSELDTTLGLSPDHYRANLLRGRILSLQGKAEEAVSNLEKAAQVQPDSREAHLFLAQAYDQLGRVSEAQREKARAQAITK